MQLSLIEIQHLYWRAGFGITPKKLDEIEKWSKEKIIEDLFRTSKKIEPLKLNLSMFNTDKSKLSENDKRKLSKEARDVMLQMNLIWLNQMVESKAQLREKLTLFFHDHFAVRINNPIANLELVNIIRENAMGDFKTMLSQVSRSPAMIIFLNNQQNKKSQPNENFAREVMELFTLGRDNGYTEKDIKEAARAFTGWRTNKSGEFVFSEAAHDKGMKTVLNQTGNFNGDDIIRILLEQKQTARYLVEKMVVFFIGRNIDQNDIESLTEAFYIDYDIANLVRNIFNLPIFFDQRTIGCKIKSPTELIVGINRLVEIDFKEPKVLIQFQRKLNQLLFYPPNVSGWTTGRGWIDSSTLMTRMKLPSLLLNFGVIEWMSDAELSENMLLKKNNRSKHIKESTAKKIKAFPDWDKFEKEFSSQKSRISDFLLQVEPLVDTQKLKCTKDQIIQIMSLPEYQLC